MVSRLVERKGLLRLHIQHGGMVGHSGTAVAGVSQAGDYIAGK